MSEQDPAVAAFAEEIDQTTAEAWEQDDSVASTDTPEIEAPTLPEPTQASPEPDEDDQMVEWGRRIATVLRDNPQLADDVVALERGDRVAIPRELLNRIEQQAPQPEQRPDIDFYADPEAAFRTLQQRQENFDRYVQHQAREDNKNALGRGLQSFRKDNELSDQELGAVMAEVHKHGFLRPDSAFMRESGNKEAGVRQALEFAYRAMSPQARPLTPREQAADMRSKRKAAATNVSPRSASRSQAEPTTPAERKSAAVAEFRAAMRGG